MSNPHYGHHPYHEHSPLPLTEKLRPLSQEVFDHYIAYMQAHGYEEFPDSNILPEKYDQFELITTVLMKGPDGSVKRFVQDGNCTPEYSMRSNVAILQYQRVTSSTSTERPTWLPYRPGN